jgi:hypothetical protein
LAYTDQTLKCRDCPNTFVFTASDQDYFQRMEYSPPIRCKPCRERKKQRQAQGGNAPDPRSARREPTRHVTEVLHRRPGSSQNFRPPVLPPTTNRDDKNDGRRRRRSWQENEPRDDDW